MQPGEPSNRSVPDRSRYRRRPMSIDGMSPARPHAIPPRPQTPSPVTTPSPAPMHQAGLPPQPVQQNYPPRQDSDDDALFKSLDTDKDAAFVPQFQPTPAEPQPEEIKDPAPKPKKPRKKLPVRAIFKVLFIIVLAGGFATGGYFLVKYEKTHNDPSHVFSNAIQAALSTAQLETVTTVGSNSTDVSMDYTVPTNPTSSNKAVVSLAGASVRLNGYGTAKNTYFQYDQLPSGTTQDVKAVADSAWVRLRSDGNLPAGINATLSHVADPRYQAPGPIVFGNFNDKQTVFLTSYIQKHNIYNYDPKKVTHTVKDGQNVLAYPVKLDISNLQLLNYSAANNEGFTPGDEVTAGVNKLEVYKGASVVVYVLSGSHEFMGVDVTRKGQTISIRYSNFNHISLPAEPETQLGWNQFSKLQQKIEAQAAAKETPSQIDSERKAKLTSIHQYLTIYYSSNKHYPTFTELNDQTWVKNNLAGLDPDAFHDPLSSSLNLSPMPTANIFAYQPTADDGKSLCDNLTQNCSHYILTANLSTGKPYTVRDP